LTTKNADTTEWMTFRGNAIGGLREAAAELRVRKAEFEAKRDWFRRKNSRIPRENSVSQALAQLFRLIRSQQAISGSGVHPIDLRHISIACEIPRRYDPGISDEAKPTDFALVLLKDNELDFRIEAKTILDGTDVRNEYLGERGLLRFEDSSNPYTVERFGGMVAYVVDSDAETWRVKIADAVVESVGLTRSRVIKIGANDYISSHHQVTVTSGESEHPYEVDVVHFTLEIDASPPHR
jgi:hypothetical protein